MNHFKNSVSVIIPTFNSGRYISKAVESVLSQTHIPDEIIVVNDGSTDNTLRSLEKFGDKINYIEIENSGPAKARNVGIRHSSTEYIAFLDADDEWLPEKILKQMTFMEENPDYALVYCDRILHDGDSILDYKSTYIKSGQLYIGDVFWEMLKTGGGCFATSCVMLRKEVLTSVGLFDEDLYTAEDTNLWLRIAYRHKIGFVPQVLVKKRIHSENISHKNHQRWGTIQNLHKIESLFPKAVSGHEKFWSELYSRKYFEMAISSVLLNDIPHSLRHMRSSIRYKFCMRYSLKYAITLLKKTFTYLKDAKGTN